MAWFAPDDDRSATRRSFDAIDGSSPLSSDADEENGVVGPRQKRRRRTCAPVALPASPDPPANVWDEDVTTKEISRIIEDKARHGLDNVERKPCPIVELPAEILDRVFASCDDDSAVARCALASHCWRQTLLGSSGDASHWRERSMAFLLRHGVTVLPDTLPDRYTTWWQFRWCRASVLRGMTICCTGFSRSDRTELRSLCEAMGATFSPNFRRASVTHLVVGRVGTPKFFAASSNGQQTALVTQNFVRHALVMGRTPDVAAHAVPSLFGLHVTVTGGALASRFAVERVVREHGGEFDANLIASSATHLVVLGRSRSGKLEFAQQHNLPAVHPRWIADSVVRGKCQKPSNYPPFLRSLPPDAPREPRLAPQHPPLPPDAGDNGLL